MFKTTRTILVAAFVLLFAGSAVAFAGDQPVTDADPAVTQQAQAHAAPVVAGMEAPLFTLISQQGEQCGDRVCPPNKYCCNASCEICAEPDQGCIQITCD